MQEKTINNALLALRKQIIRDGGQGLDYVESLLALRGVDMPRVMPAKRSDAARKGQMRRIILEALSDGPKPLRQIVTVVERSRPEIPPRAAYVRTTQALDKMKNCGMVVSDSGCWVLNIAKYQNQ